MDFSCPVKTENLEHVGCFLTSPGALMGKYSFVITSQFLLWYSVEYILRDKNFLE